MEGGQAPMEDVVIVSGVRTAIGTLGGALSETSASDLGAAVIREAVSRAGLQPEQIDQVILGCVGQVAEDAYIARHASVKGGMPIGTPAYTVNRICGSGLEAINTAARWLQTGDAEIIVAGGTENMSMMPFLLRKARFGYRLGHSELEDGTVHLVTDPFEKIHMGITAENLAEKYEVSREVQDEYSLRSQERARAAIDAGYFKDQILPLEVKKGRDTVTFDTDEHPRATSMEALGKLRAAFKPDGNVTAGQLLRHQRRRGRARGHDRLEGPRAGPEAAHAPGRARRVRRRSRASWARARSPPSRRRWRRRA